jgi:hypothetical protein
MSLSFEQEIHNLASVDLFERNAKGELKTGLFIGRPFYIDYSHIHLLIADSWKMKAKGIPQGSFLLAYYENEESVKEAILLRVLSPKPLPTDNDVIRSMVDYYKDNLKTAGPDSQLDSFTRYEFSFSGLNCRILGTFYKDENSNTIFGADVENFYSAHNYMVLKPNNEILKKIVNFRSGELAGLSSDINIGKVRYSSSRRFQITETDVPVYVGAQDFLGKRTALFGMTRTGKSNTVKKIIEATMKINAKSNQKLNSNQSQSVDQLLEPFTKNKIPKYPAGQIVFDVNGEYANPNLQDEGTAISEIYKKETIRYSVIEKPGFKVMKVNFYEDIESGFELIKSYLNDETGDYVKSFLSVDLTPPEDKNDHSLMTRYKRKVAAYKCCLHRANFKSPKGYKVYFPGHQDISTTDPSQGITLEDATEWWKNVWETYKTNVYFENYKKKGREWADDDLKAILRFLTRAKEPGGAENVSGYIKLRPIANQHTDSVGKPFEIEIIEHLRKGNIVIIDLSQGDPNIQKIYSERICKKIFSDSMSKFIETKPNNFIQFYFEEAHNLFPKKDDKDLNQIYNRIAKEGAKLNLGLIYATQEVSSISSNILKNTQNWFIAHLNNEDETKELKKYYDFEDFVSSLIQFSPSSDQGFVRMKTYSNPFVVPVQINKFSINAI